MKIVWYLLQWIFSGLKGDLGWIAHTWFTGWSLCCVRSLGVSLLTDHCQIQKENFYFSRRVLGPFWHEFHRQAEVVQVTNRSPRSQDCWTLLVNMASSSRDTNQRSSSIKKNLDQL